MQRQSWQRQSRLQHVREGLNGGVTTPTSTTSSARGWSQEFTLQLCKLGFELACINEDLSPPTKGQSGLVPRWNEVALFFCVLAISASISLILREVSIFCSASKHAASYLVRRCSHDDYRENNIREKKTDTLTLDLQTPSYTMQIYAIPVMVNLSEVPLFCSRLLRKNEFNVTEDIVYRVRVMTHPVPPRLPCLSMSVTRVHNCGLLLFLRPLPSRTPLHCLFCIGFSVLHLSIIIPSVHSSGSRSRPLRLTQQAA